MSSSGKTYLVVAYDHDDGKFTVDKTMSIDKFPNDTWDTVEERWCMLNSNTDMWQDIDTLEWELGNLLVEELED